MSTREGEGRSVKELVDAYAAKDEDVKETQASDEGALVLTDRRLLQVVGWAENGRDREQVSSIPFDGMTGISVDATGQEPVNKGLAIVSIIVALFGMFIGVSVDSSANLFGWLVILLGIAGMVYAIKSDSGKVELAIHTPDEEIEYHLPQEGLSFAEKVVEESGKHRGTLLGLQKESPAAPSVN